MGVPAPVTAGAVLSGAYFGDKLSPLSDSCVLSAAMADIDVIDHVRGIMPVSLTAFAITGIAFTIFGLSIGESSADLTQVEYVMNALAENFNISLFAFIPMIIVIILLILRLPSLPVITFGSVLGIIWGIAFRGFIR